MTIHVHENIVVRSVLSFLSLFAVLFLVCGCNGCGNNTATLEAEKAQPKDNSGTYRVVVNLYSNCDPTIATNWTVVTRYKGEVVPVSTGHNPATGIYPAGARNGDMTEVMTFTIDSI